MKEAAGKAGVPVQYKTFDGKNWECLVQDITESGYDLVVMGALGMGAVKDSQVGSVTDRVIRRIKVDTLVVREPQPFRDDASDRVLVAIDGSPQSFAGLRTAIALGKILGKRVEAIGVYDPYLHYAMFNGILTVAMIVTMGFIRENGRYPDLIAGHMHIEQQQDVSVPQPTAAP